MALAFDLHREETMYVRKCNKGIQAGCPLGTLRDSSSQVEVGLPTYQRSKKEGEKKHMTYDRLLREILWNKDVTLDWCQSMGLLAREETCHICGGHMTLVKTSDRLDGVKWQCRRQFEKKRHRVEKSIRSNSWFENSNLSIEEIIKFVYWWSEGLRQDQIRKQLGLGEHTAVGWDMLCRETCEVVMMSGSSSEDTQIGGAGRVVHVEGSKAGKREHHKGSSIEGHLVFGGREEDSRNTFLVTAENDAWETVMPLIKQWIAPGTTIVGDCWKTHSSNLKELDYSWESGSNSVWMAGGAHVIGQPSARARRRQLDSSHLAEALYRYAHHGEDMFYSFMWDVAKVFNPTGAYSLEIPT